MSSHPGSTLQEAVKLSLFLRDNGIHPEQVQDFYPTPGTISTCMYYTELDPYTMEPVYVPKTPKEKAMQRALLQYYLPQNRQLVLSALKQAGRQDLIGTKPGCLVAPEQHAGNSPKTVRKRTATPQRRRIPTKPQTIFQKITAALIAAALPLLSGCSLDDAESYLTDTIQQAFGGEDGAEAENNGGSGTGSCTVHFLDVGQGDSELIVTDTAAVLIDAGEQSAADDILADLQQYGITKLDWIIGTHPHADHIGGFPDILSYAAQNSDLTISNVMIPQLPDDMIPTTRTYEKFLDGVDENGLILTQATDITIDLGSASLEIIPSPGNDYSSLNDYSICAYLTCGDTSFFFTGDASKPEEKDLLRSGALDGIQADVLKVGHHGSRESSTADFLAQLQPSYAVISCGAGNSYGHPHSEAVERLQQYCGDQIWRTDESGTVTIQSDGASLTVSTEK